MYKAVGVWTWPKPEDESAFETHYIGKHVPAAQKLPGIQKITILKAGDDAREPDICRVAEVYWETPEAFAQAAESPEWAAMVEDAMWMMERFGIQLKSAHGWEEPVAAG